MDEQITRLTMRLEVATQTLASLRKKVAAGREDIKEMIACTQTEIREIEYRIKQVLSVEEPYDSNKIKPA